MISIDNLIENLKKKYKLESDSLNSWKDKVMELLNQKIINLKHSVHVSQVTPVLGDPIIDTDLKKLQDDFVIVPVDKAANNFSFICKKFYLLTLVKELGFPDGSTTTYTLNRTTVETIISSNTDFCEHLGYEITEEDKTLPIIYWPPKIHKSPTGQRFIIASKHCITKPL